MTGGLPFDTSCHLMPWEGDDATDVADVTMFAYVIHPECDHDYTEGTIVATVLDVNGAGQYLMRCRRCVHCGAIGSMQEDGGDRP